MSLRKQVEDKDSAELIFLIKEYESAEADGIIGSGPLRDEVDEYIKYSHFYQSPILIARDIAFECYRRIANTCIARH